MASFDELSGSGSVVTDLGLVVAFPASAFVRSGLLLLRPGQRVTMVMDADGDVALVTIPGFPASEATGP